MKDNSSQPSSSSVKPDQGKLFLVCGPTASGKNTLIEILKNYCKEKGYHFYFSVSATTRKIRPHEVDGENYLFLSADDFSEKIGQDYFVEYENVHGKFYGTPRESLYKHLNNGSVCAADVDVFGAQRIVKKMNKDGREEPITVYIYVESDDEIKARFYNRFEVTEENATAEQKADLANRLTRKAIEDKERATFKYIINSQSKEADAKAFLAIIKEQLA